MKNSTIPNFPDFRLLKIQDKPLIDRFIKRYAPYSDFNFVSMWSYNTEKDLKICQLNGNLVFLMRDYIDESMVPTYIGNKDPISTIKLLLNYSKKYLFNKGLSIIPEINIAKSKREIKKHFHLKPDRGDFDYILSLSKLTDLPGSEFANKRNKILRFTRDFPDALCETLDLTDKIIQKELLEVFKRWSASRQRKDVKHELKAIKCLFRDVKHFKLHCFGIFVNKKLEAFSINETLPRNYAITHFTKADPTKIGVFEFLYHEAAKQLKLHGSLYLNREQDLDIEGLRIGKMSWRPIKFLKKYTISEKLTSY